MGLKQELVAALKRLNMVEATDVQELTIPIALHGKDVIVRAKTGTGKTCAFLIPVLQRIKASRRPEALIIAPTRELALQIADVTLKIKGYGVNVAVVYGGASINVQVDALRRGANVVIGTPGRMIDLMERGALDLSGVNTVVLDEADTMLDMGFIEDIEYILSTTPSVRQTMILSATIPQRIQSISSKYMNNAEFISVGDEEEVTVNTIKHAYCVANGAAKFHTLLAYINDKRPGKAIVFLQTQREADVVYNFLHSQGISATLLHGGLTQARRERSLMDFRKHAQFLIATNVAARGLDIENITDVINFDVPDDPYVYVHRVGRSARMGKNGRAFTIIRFEQKNLISDIEYVANIKMERVFPDTTPYKDIRVDFGSRYRERDRSGERHFDRNRGFSRGGRGDRGDRGDDRRHRSHSGGGGHSHFAPNPQRRRPQ
jgi:ATP-dependent RNA helicase DeaD